MESLMKAASKLFAAFLAIGSASIVHAQTPAVPPVAPQQATPGSPMVGGDIQATMQKMLGQMTKIHSVTDPAERQKLMIEHMSTMREAMGTMMKMGGPGTGMMPGGGMMGAPSTAPAPSELPGRMGMMEQRMGMMQGMMDQMMQHQDMMDRRQ
jgi:hypothetical protein